MEIGQPEQRVLTEKIGRLLTLTLRRTFSSSKVALLALRVSNSSCRPFLAFIRLCFSSLAGGVVRLNNFIFNSELFFKCYRKTNGFRKDVILKTNFKPHFTKIFRSFYLKVCCWVLLSCSNTSIVSDNLVTLSSSSRT